MLLILSLLFLFFPLTESRATQFSVQRVQYLFNHDLPSVADTEHFRLVRDEYVSQSYTVEDQRLFREVGLHVCQMTLQIGQIIDLSTKGAVSGQGYEWLVNVTDTFGNRHVGSDRLEKAIDNVVARAANVDQFDRVHTQDVPNLPNWKRGEDDTAVLILPREYRMDILATGGSPPGNVTADAVVVNTFEQLDNLTDAMVAGKIVIFNQEYKGYGATSKYRKGAKQAAARGAVGVLIRSVTPSSVYSPHTGQGAIAGIPSACITVEDAQMLQRMQDAGEQLRIHMALSSHSEEPCTSRNVLFEITGSELPKEIVLISCHFDSWDVGQGAMDDGAGCATMWQALLAIKRAGLIPRRTIRVAFWTAEEQGMYGSQAYHKTNPGNGDGVTTEKFIYVSESDEGAFRPMSWNAQMQTFGTAAQRYFISFAIGMINLNGIPLSMKKTTASGLGDVAFWAQSSEIAGSWYLNVDANDKYFTYHHTRADTMTVMSKEDIDYTAAVFGSIAWAVAQNGL